VPSGHIQREEFGNVEFFKGLGGNLGARGGVDTQTLLQIIIFILIALFVIQLVETLYTKFGPGI